MASASPALNPAPNGPPFATEVFRYDQAAGGGASDRASLE